MLNYIANKFIDKQFILLGLNCMNTDMPRKTWKIFYVHLSSKKWKCRILCKKSSKNVKREILFKWRPKWQFIQGGEWIATFIVDGVIHWLLTDIL